MAFIDLSDGCLGAGRCNRQCDDACVASSPLIGGLRESLVCSVCLCVCLTVVQLVVSMVQGITVGHTCGAMSE